MALYAENGTDEIVGTRHETKFAAWCSRLSYEQITAIRAALQKELSSRTSFVSSEIPGSDWAGTPYQPIYDHACQGDFKESGYCFGVFVWEAAQIHPGKWRVGPPPWGRGKKYTLMP